MKKELAKILALIVIIVVAMNTTIVMAASQGQINNNKEKIQEKQQQLDNIRAEKSDTIKEVEDISVKITDYETQITELNQKIDELTEKISESEENLKKAEEDYKKQEKLLNERLIASYEAGDTSYLDVLLSSKNIADLISNYFLVTEVASYDSELIEKIDKQKQEIEATKQQLETDKTELDTSKETKQAVTNQLKVVKSEKNEHVEELSQTESDTQEEIQELQAENKRMEAELNAAAQRYKDKLEAMRKNSGSSGGSSNPGGNYTGGGSGYLQKPVQTGYVSAGMYYPSGSYHGAIDYAVGLGTTVYAAAEGVVLSTVHRTDSYGNYIVIEHPNGLRTWYCHGNGTFYVSQGDPVSKGQPIMLSGNSGNSSGPHLHFEVRVPNYDYNTCRVNPSNYM